jgi:hypothetical protein
MGTKYRQVRQGTVGKARQAGQGHAKAGRARQAGR